MASWAWRSKKTRAEEEKKNRVPRGSDQFADKPTIQVDYDLLHFSRLVNFLADFISDDEKRRTITTIGVYGEWGSGKTSFLNLLDERLQREKHIRPIWFYAWRYNKQDDLWAALLQSILNQVGNLEGDQLLNKLQVKYRLWRYSVNLGVGTWEVTRKFLLGGLRILLILFVLYAILYITFGLGGKSIAAFLNTLPVLNTIPPAVQILIVNAILLFLGAAAADVGKLRDLLVGDIQVDFTKFERKGNFRDHISMLDEFNQEFQDLIALLRPRNKPLVVIIDDLDRCLPESALRVLESIKVFLDNSDCIFLLGLDKQVLEKAIAERYRELSRIDHNQPGNRQELDLHHHREYHLEYFDKIIPLAIVVPQLLQKHEDIVRFIRALNRDEAELSIDEEVEACADVFGYALSSNPRKIKRTLRSFRFVRDLVKARIEEQRQEGLAEKDIKETAIRFSLLAKLILIQNHFPSLYESAIRQPSLLGDLETYFRNPVEQTSDQAAKAESYAKEYQGLREMLIRSANDEDSFVGQDIHFYVYQIGTLAEVGSSIRRQRPAGERSLPRPTTAQLAAIEAPLSVGAYANPAAQLPFANPDPFFIPANTYAPVPIFWRVPISNGLFTAREDILRRLHDTFAQRLASHDAFLVLCGLGGIGKTQIAIEYAHRYRQEYNAVFWARAETREMLMTDYAAIAELVNLREKNERDQNQVVEAVKSWLERQTGWLLVLDGVNDVSKIADLLPPLCSGHVLLTTRQQNVVSPFLSLPVDSLAAQEGELLLLRRAKIIGPTSLMTEASDEDREQAREIAQKLGGLPLALDQAGAYIEETRCGLEGYLERYQKESAELLMRRGSSGADHPEPVAMTWRLSLGQIEKETPGLARDAEQLLSICSLLAPDAIPIDLFRKGAAGIVGLEWLATSEERLDALIRALEKFSFVRRDADGQTLTIHRLVQEIVKDKEDIVNELKTIHLVSNAFPKVVDYTTWPECRRYLSQALACIELARWKKQDTSQEVEYTSSLEAASLFDRAGSYLRERAQYNRAEELLLLALNIRQGYEKSWFRKDAGKVATLNALALLYLAQGRYAEAEEFMLRVLTIYEQEQGAEHLDVATCLNNLASLYSAQNRFTNAEPLLRRALAIRRRKLGAEHLDVANNMSELALICRTQGRYDEAIGLLRDAQRIRQRALGKDHPDVATTMNILAGLYRTVGEYAKAEQLLLETLHIRDLALGQDHPDTAAILNDLAALYYAQGKYNAAEPMLQRALSICKKASEEHRPNVAVILNNLARLYTKRKNFKEAELSYTQALAIYDQFPEADSSNLIAILDGYASLLRQVRREQEAIDVETRMRAVQERSQQEGGVR